MEYRTRLDSATTVQVSGDKITITQDGENWGDPWPTPSSSITISNLSLLIQSLQDIQKMKYSEW